MNFIKRAFTSIQRRLGKSAILLVLIFILGNIIIGAIAVKQAVINTEQGVRKSLGAIATIQIDSEKLGKEIDKNPDFDYNSIESLKPELIEKIGKMSAVKYFDYNIYSSVEMPDLKRYSVQSEEEEGQTTVVNGMPNYFSLTGVQYSKVLAIQEGEATLVGGRVFSDEEVKNGTAVVMVGKKFAELNNIQVGSKILLKMPIRDYNNTDVAEPPLLSEVNKEVEVIGIYEPKIEVASQKKENGAIDKSFLDEEKENNFYTPNKFIASYTKEFMAEYVRVLPQSAGDLASYSDTYTPIYILKDPLSLQGFKDEVTFLLPQYYTIVDSGSSYDSIAGPMHSVQNIANGMLYVAIVATIVILGLLVTLFLRDRKHEIGIYLSLGEKRNKIISQIVIEVISVALIAITLSLFTGTILAQSVSKSILQDQFVAQEEKNALIVDDGTYLGASGIDLSKDISSEDIISMYNVSLDTSVIILFYVIGLGTVFVSTIIPMVYISRLNPKKIMM